MTKTFTTTLVNWCCLVLLATPRAHAQVFGAWSEPANLGPSVNSTAADQHPAISRDGLSLYFVSTRTGGFGNRDIYVSKRESVDAPWESPVNLGPVINTTDIENAPTLSRDGHLLFFGSNRPGGCGGFDLWMAFRRHTDDDFGWETPVNLGCAINTPFDEDGPTYFEDETSGITFLYFTSLNRPANVGDWDIYVSTLQADRTFGPGALVSELSSPARDTRTSISRDGRAMYITSNRAGGLGGLDIWVTARTWTSEAWSHPVNVGAPVNTSADDGAPVLSFDGTALYFYSIPAGGVSGTDVYVTTRVKRQGASH